MVVTPVVPEPRPSTNKSKVAAFVPSTFAHVIRFIFTSLSEATVIKVAVAVFVRLNPALAPRIDETFTILGFAIIYFLFDFN